MSGLKDAMSRETPFSESATSASGDVRDLAVLLVEEGHGERADLGAGSGGRGRLPEEEHRQGQG